jgi:hypothetical protein
MKRKTCVSIVFLLIGVLCGCAHLEFSDGGLTYYDPKPYLFVSRTKDCVTTASVIMIPEQRKKVKFRSGYGTADLSISLTNGMITSAGQKTDTKVPETITAVSGLTTALASTVKMAGAAATTCPPYAKLYSIENGIPSNTPSNVFDVK